MPHGNLLITDRSQPAANPRPAPDEMPADRRSALPSGWWVLPGITLGLMFWLSLFWLFSLWS